ncbi:MAG: hypothetical protein WBC69_18250, partial [Geitlerinemataceae cyanobacterium]
MSEEGSMNQIEQLWRISPLLVGAIVVLGGTPAVTAQEAPALELDSIPSMDELAPSTTELSQ